MQQDEQTIREFDARWIDAVNAGDLTLLLTLMTDDAVFLNPGGEPIGKDGFSAGFLAAHGRALIDCRSELEDVVVVGDVAYTVAKDSRAVTPRAGGETVRLAGHRMTIYRKQSDGQWLLARDAHTLTPVVREG